MLITMGVFLEVYWENLELRVGDGESCEAWSEFFSGFRTRVLVDTDFVVSDSRVDVDQSFSKADFCGTILQHCQMHFSHDLGQDY